MKKEEIHASLKKVKDAFGEAPPDLAIVLGSGLGSFTNVFRETRKLSYTEIPGFHPPSIDGHAGELILGEVGERKVLAFRGRFHFYEGHSISLTALPARVAGAWGIRNFVVSNAAGGIRNSFSPGTMMMIRDHMSFLGHNPLRGPNIEEFGPRFVDMTEAYDSTFRETGKRIADELGIAIEEGVYAAFPGPTYETPAEINMLRVLGADAVGMSTVPEVVAAKHHGMRVFGLSCITNMASGSHGQGTVNHQEVIETAKRVEKTFADFLAAWIERVELS